MHVPASAIARTQSATSGGGFKYSRQFRGCFRTTFCVLVLTEIVYVDMHEVLLMLLISGYELGGYGSCKGDSVGPIVRLVTGEVAGLDRSGNDLIVE